MSSFSVDVKTLVVTLVWHSWYVCMYACMYACMHIWMCNNPGTVIQHSNLTVNNIKNVSGPFLTSRHASKLIVRHLDTYSYVNHMSIHHSGYPSWCMSGCSLHKGTPVWMLIRCQDTNQDTKHPSRCFSNIWLLSRHKIRCNLRCSPDFSTATWILVRHKDTHLVFVCMYIYTYICMYVCLWIYENKSDVQTPIMTLFRHPDISCYPDVCPSKFVCIFMHVCMHDWCLDTYWAFWNSSKVQISLMTFVGHLTYVCMQADMNIFVCILIFMHKNPAILMPHSNLTIINVT